MAYILLALGIVFFLVFAYNVIIEPIYAFFFRKPIYVHWYWFPKKLSLPQMQILHDQFDFYQKLPPLQQKYFEHRVATFIQNYPFIGKEGLEVTDEMKVLIAATAVMLTFGMRNYLFTVIDKIIIYPDVYYSTFNQEYHKGEFNPRMKAIVFSWKHFLEGYQISNDNLNLGLHEFGHVLHYQGLKSSDTSATIFAVTYEQIIKEVKYPANYSKLLQSNYFRIYAYTNEFEFIAVILEHFFETPEEFKKEFPPLFEKVKVMINFTQY
ncbi:zinc-dependent peptidase [Flavobacterium sp. NRK F7]|uniref:zinc-dependent peptidase n=1 Tax=Flavobacterium sp. NRK F7 TaxID=2954930 RepID=UPI002091C16F|nr:zinc-dependent peptidase [Flavobacterium sp. NRK F7]MCO6162341.1 zinc-dependent peptidase [Flavobacterium sp. NRK F7]